MPEPARAVRSTVIAASAASAASAALLAAFVPAAAAAQFVLWETQSAPNPFSVTTAVRGVAPDPSVKLEALVGYAGAGNQFSYHVTPALTATSPDAGSRTIATTQTIHFADLGIQSAFNGRCCQNRAIGLTDDSSLHMASNFGAGTSAETLIGNPEFTDSWAAFGDFVPGLTESPAPLGPIAFISALAEAYGLPFLISLAPEGTISFRRVVAGSRYPGVGLSIRTIDGAPGSTQVEQVPIADCQGVASNWHFGMGRSDALDEQFVACVKTNGNLVLKRVTIDPDAVAEIPLASGVGTTSTIFTYLHVAVCPLSTGTVVGTVIPRQSLGSTTFFATYLSPTGTVVGTSQATLPGARANHQAFACRPHGDFATFVYHGTGQAATTTTDTFFVQAGEATLVAPPGGGTALLVRRVTESRRTDSADLFPTTIYSPSGQRVALDFQGPEPVAEIQAGTSNNVRYGGIRTPLFFHNFESGDLRLFSDSIP